MEIAILMSTYNGEKYLDEQIKSLFSQNIEEHITLYIRDDGSKDNTIEIIERWKKKMDIFLFERKNVGPADSFWELMMDQNIQADYYAFCDQDDIWDVDKLKKGISAIRNKKGGILWCSNCRIIDAQGNILQSKMNDRKPNFTIISQLVCGSTQGCAMIFDNELRRYIIQKNIQEVPMHDFVIMMYAIAKGMVMYDHIPAFSYRVHSSNVVANRGKTIGKRMKELLNKWFSSKHIYENSKFINEFLVNNYQYLNEETIVYLERFINCKKNILNRIKIITNPLSNSENKRAERSFKIRVFLGII